MPLTLCQHSHSTHSRNLLRRRLPFAIHFLSRNPVLSTRLAWRRVCGWHGTAREVRALFWGDSGWNETPAVIKFAAGMVVREIRAHLHRVTKVPCEVKQTAAKQFLVSKDFSKKVLTSFTINTTLTEEMIMTMQATFRFTHTPAAAQQRPQGNRTTCGRSSLD